jgi:hypothetical protein
MAGAIVTATIVAGTAIADGTSAIVIGIATTIAADR